MSDERLLVGLLREIARERGIEFEALFDGWIVRLSRAGRVRWTIGYDFDLNNCCAQQLAKDKAGAAAALALGGVACVEHALFIHPQNRGYVADAGNWTAMLDFARRHDFDVVCKPNDGTGGAEVTRARTPRELEEAVHRLFARGRAVALCPYLPISDEFRTIVLQGRPLLTYRKVRPAIRGDGRASRLELLARRYKDSGEAEPLARILAQLAQQKVDLTEIVPVDQPWFLNWKHNLGLGAGVELVDASNDGAQALSELAIHAAWALGLEFASVDSIRVESELALQVLEVNGGVMMESFARMLPEGRAIAKGIYADVIEAMFPGAALDNPRRAD